MGADRARAPNRIRHGPTQHHHPQFSETEEEVRSDHPVRKSEEPRRQGEEGVDDQVNPKRQDPERAELIVGQQAVDDRADAENDGHPALGSVGESQQGWGAIRSTPTR
jgi:hypothetical protein